MGLVNTAVPLDAGQDGQEGGLQGSDGVGAGGGTGGGAHGDDLQRGTAPGPGRSGHGNPTAPGDTPAREGGASYGAASPDSAAEWSLIEV